MDGSAIHYTFRPAVTPTAPDGFGSEPSLLATKDALYFTSVLGSASARGDGVWKSLDQGRNWTYLGKADYPFGGGDSDIDVLGDGRLLLTGQWRPAAIPGLPVVGSPYVTGGESVSYSTDGGKSWTPSPTAGYLPAADRNWLATSGDKVAYLVYNDAGTGLMVGKTTDGGMTWLPPVVVQGSGSAGGVAGGPQGIAGDAVVDPKDGNLYIPYGPGPGGGTVQTVYRSSDGGMTFTAISAHKTPDAQSSGAIFSTLAIDPAGTLWLAFAETVPGGRMGIFLTSSSDHGDKWSAPTLLTTGAYTAVFPWVVALGPGRVAVAYLSAFNATKGFLPDAAPADTQWIPAVAFVEPGGKITRIGAGPTNHKGPLCTGGTGCDPQYRRLGDFFEAAAMPDGRVAVVWADDTGDKVVNHVAVQATGPGLT